MTIDCRRAEELIRIKDGIPSRGFLPLHGVCGDSATASLEEILVVAAATATAALASGQAVRAEEVGYVEAPIRAFAIATAFWGVVAGSLALFIQGCRTKKA